ncbi:MAG: hypothetical protein HYV07_08465 [Deltaproteobacteria bacterium]|nr:hypothetical protein [Deltaproteobacteria bacterium]
MSRLFEGGVGVQDVPLEKSDLDDLGISPYATALAQFAATCKTPISIGVQQWIQVERKRSR